MISFFADNYIYIIIIHVFAVAVGLGSATVTDILFFNFLKDFRISKNEAEIMANISRIIWVALAVIVVSGIALFLPQSDVLLESPKFLMKMTVIAVLIVNGLFLNFLITPNIRKIDFSDHSKKAGFQGMRKLSFALGAISIVSWYSSFILASLPSLNMTYIQMFFFYCIVLLFAVTVSQVFEKRMGVQKIH